MYIPLYILKVRTTMATRTPTALAKWGNSTGIRIPKALAERAELREGDPVQVEVEGPGVLIIRAVKQERSLDELLSAITSKNRHGETGWGQPRGNEAW